MVQVEFHVLGPLEVLADGERVALGGPRPRAVLGTLLAHLGAAVPVERLIDQVWQDTPPPTAVASLQMHLSALRKVLGDRLVTTNAGYLINAEPDEVDAIRFEAAITKARTYLSQRPARAAADLAAALSSWRGEPYGGVSAGSDVAAARVRLSQLRLSVLEDRFEVELALGRHAQAAPELAGLAAEHPGSARLARSYLLALYRCGRAADAQAAYEAMSRRLETELGAQPAADVVALAKAIARHDPTLDAPTAIPVAPSRFIGRRGELEELADRLGRSRLLTITGPGGSGKTRLSLELARDTAADHPDGVFVVELAALPPGGEVAERLATQLSVRERDGEPLARTLAEHLQGMRALIVLDNCEHVIDSAAALAAQLLGQPGGLRLVATSREPLGVDGEQVWLLGGLRVPTEHDPPTVIARSEAVRLLADRGSAATADFTINAGNAAMAAKLCRILDGLPLAIELAAAQLRTTPLEQLAQQIEQLDRALTLADRRSRTKPDRHRTMRAAIDWSYRLLGPAEQALFRRVSVFAGGFVQEAAEAVDTVSADAASADTTEDVLTRLVDQSMLTVERRPAGVRFRMLELVRQYADERLTENGEADDVRARHAAWCVSLARGSAQFGGADHPNLVRRLDLEEGNLRAAMDWCLGPGGDPVRALEIAGPLWWYWWARGLMATGSDWLLRGLTETDPAPSALRGSALRAAAALSRNSGNFAQARELGEQCLAVYQALSEPTGLISALGGLCITALAQQDYVAALEYGTRSGELAEQAGDRQRYASALNNIGLALRCLGRLPEAESTSVQALENWRAVGDQRGEAATLSNLGRLARMSGDTAQARAKYTASLAQYRGLDLVEGMLDMLEALAGIEVEQGRAESGLLLLTVAQRERDRLGAPLFVQDEIDDRDQALAAAHSALGQAAPVIVEQAHNLVLDAVVDELLKAAEPESGG